MFTKFDSPEIVYMLGLLWADGNFGSNKNYRIGLELVSEDMRHISPILEKIGKWGFYTRKRNGWKPTTSAYISNKISYQLLCDYGFKDKSTTSPTELLYAIPSNFRHLFFRGLIDGDGCFYFNETRYLRQFVLTSSFEQDWSYIENLFKNLNINYKICNVSRINKKGIINKSSRIRITKKRDLKILHDYIYSNYLDIGLPRKYEMSKLITA